MIAKTDSPDIWKRIFGAIGTIVEEATFTATEEGLRFRAMDPSHVALVDVDLPPAVFQKWEVGTLSKEEFTVRVEDIMKILRRSEKGDTVEVALESGNDLLHINLRNGYERTFEIHLIESTYGATPIPKLALANKFELTLETWKKILDDIETISDHINIKSSSDKLMFNGKSDYGTASALFPKAHKDILVLEVKEEAEANYSIDYLKNFAAKIDCERVTLQYANKMPLIIKTKVCEAGGDILLYLAPRHGEN